MDHGMSTMLIDHMTSGSRPTSSDDGQNDDNGEVIPVVLPAQHNGIDTDSDISDGEEQMSVSNDYFMQ